jgi:hypothetical protein
MWWTVVLLGIAVNFEPTRIGLLALTLTRQRPLAQLLTFLGTAFCISCTVGLLVLFVFHRGLFTSANFHGPLIQLGIGVAVLVVAALVATNSRFFRLRDPASLVEGPDGEDIRFTADAAPRRVDLLATRVRGLVHGESRWLSSATGAAMAMPTVEYMALLALIISSGSSAWAQAGALFTFLGLGNLIGLVFITSHVVAPDRTRQRVRMFNLWIRSRRRRDVAAALALVGAVLVVAGWTQL